MGFLSSFVLLATFSEFLVVFCFICYISAFKSYIQKIQYVRFRIGARAEENLVMNN